MNYFVNPNLLINPLEGDLFCLINPYLSNGIKIINKNQYIIFKQLNKISVEDILAEHINEKEVLNIFFKSLEKKQFISASGVFDIPKVSKNIHLLDFWIHVTDSCNLSCQYCSIATKISRNKLNFNNIPNLISTIIFIVNELDIQELSLRFAGGEPMLNFEIIKLIFNNINKKLPNTCRLKCTILTNLTILSPKILEFLSVNQIFISASLDGIGEYHDITRTTCDGRGTFHTVVENIRVLTNKNINVNVNCVISNRNIDGIPLLIDFLVKNKIRHRLSIVRGEEVNYDKVLAILCQVYKTMEEYIKNGYKFSQLHRLCDLKLINPTVFTCGAGRNSFVIYTNGDLYACPHLIGCKDKIIGNIYDRNKLLNIIKKRPSSDNTISIDCIKCVYRYVCTGGCPIFRFGGKSIACKFYKEIIPIIYHLLAMERLYEIKKNIANNSLYGDSIQI